MSEFKATIKAELDTSSVEQQINNLSKDKRINLKVDDGGIKQAHRSVTSFGDSIKKALNIGSGVAILTQGFRAISTAAKDAREAIKDFDAAIKDVRIVTGNSYADALKMVSAYNEMGQSLGATTREISDSATAWLRQGKSAEEAGRLIRESMKLSKIGFLDSAEATQYLTSALNGYRLSADEASSVVDKLATLDSSAAITAGGLAEAMSRTATTAHDAGISMDQLLGYMSVAGEVTQLSMASIGTAFRSMLTRMGDIKSGKLKLIDEDGTEELLSNVELTLQNAGIKLRKSATEFRDFSDVLDELAQKWDSLNDLQQAALSKSIAGTRQAEIFRVLMANYDTAKKYMELSANSAGSADAKFLAYLDSIEAKTKSLQASFESLAVNTVDTKTYGGIIDATTALVDFIDKTNLVKGAMAGVATVGAIKGFSSLAAGITSATVRMQEFHGALQLVRAGNIGEAQINQLATLTANLSQNQLKAVLSSKMLTAEQRIAILTAKGMTTAEANAALSAMGLATAEGAATGATLGLSGALKGLWATLLANPLTAVMVAVTAGVSVYHLQPKSRRSAAEIA